MTHWLTVWLLANLIVGFPVWCCLYIGRMADERTGD